MENHAHTKCEPEVWTALSTETRVSSRLKTHLNLLIILQSLAQWEVTNHNLCLLGTTLTKTAPRQPLSLISV